MFNFYAKVYKCLVNKSCANSDKTLQQTVYTLISSFPVTHKADIHTCILRVVSEYGELATTQSEGDTNACTNMRDGHINFPPIGAKANFDFEFPELPEAIPNDTGVLYNGYAKREAFGIIAADIIVVKYDTYGTVHYK